MSLTLDRTYINQYLYDFMEFDKKRRSFKPMDNLHDALEVAEKIFHSEIDKSFKLDFTYKFFRATVEVDDIHYKSDLRMMPEHALCEALMMYLDEKGGSTMKNEQIVYEYECEECDNLYLSEDPDIRYCDSEKCLDKDVRIYKVIYDGEDY